MLPSLLRIRKSSFADIFKKGSVFHSKDLNLFVLKDKLLVDKSLFSFSASKKVSKIAPKRNKLRRQGYSAVKILLKNIQPGYLCVFVYKNTASTISFQDIQEQVDFLLRKARILK